MSDEPIRLPPPDPIAVQALVDAFEQAYLDRPTDDQMRPLVRSFWDASWEVRLAAWSILTPRYADNLDKLEWVHRFLAEAVLDVFGVPIGEAGIGVVPRKILLHTDKV